MNYFRIISSAFLFSVVIFLAQAYASMSNEYDVPELAGYRLDTYQPITIPFDLKTKFSSIESVEIRLEGRAVPGSAISTVSPQQNYSLPVDLHFRIAEKFNPRYLDMGVPVAEFGPLNDFFQVQNNFILKGPGLKHKNKQLNWSFLQDGTGEIQISWGGGCPDACTFVSHALAEITRATLIIKGNVHY